MDTPTIGTRVRDLLDEQDGTQRALAAAVGMPEDALSRAIRGTRGFAAIEVARVAEELGVDVHWLITGKADPRRLRIAARHAYDHGTATYGNGTREQDEQVLEGVRLAYHQAFGEGLPEPTRLPTDVASIRELLGDGWQRHFAQRMEERLGVDVVRVGDLGTAYSLVVLGRRAVVALPDREPWGRANFSLAHELAHLAAGDHDVDDADADDSAERRANAFAAELLMPESRLRALDWSTIDAPRLGELLWELGVTTAALAARLDSLAIRVPEVVVTWLRMATPQFLRHRAFPASRWTEVTDRERASRARRFPTALIQKLEDGVAAGRVNPRTLAWVAGVEVEDLEVLPPDQPDTSTDELAAALGLSLA
ncbi:ImmA/IrrE family metallo-endopeptidase [Cellulosimicrobium sp. BIT-GX5]|uniref:ImmA/IrrE family metallo-endopeptidase n=1 Tax=Cellulosimicrobium composti TaxID=2672572 RepID=A0A6N7ZGR0_9MICO|nr:XRE family transcriptional regulator [Cellulosimicrobium composti]MTG88644.1 ImmA/IrrE family metallo-endopeptidase [Cellulosimicrobium composti]